MGKAPIGVARLAKKYKIPVIAFAGSVTGDAGQCNLKGIDAFFPILRGITTLEEAMRPECARENLADAAEQAFRLMKVLERGGEADGASGKAKKLSGLPAFHRPLTVILPIWGRI